MLSNYSYRKSDGLGQKTLALLLILAVVVWIGAPTFAFAQELPPEEPPQEETNPPAGGEEGAGASEEGAGEEQGSTEEGGTEQGPTEEEGQTNNEESNPPADGEGSEEGSGDEGQSSEEQGQEEGSGEENSGHEANDEDNTGDQDTGAGVEGTGEAADGENAEDGKGSTEEGSNEENPEENGQEATGEEGTGSEEEGSGEEAGSQESDGEGLGEEEAGTEGDPGETGTEPNGAQGGEGGEGGEGDTGEEGETGENSGSGEPAQGDEGEATQDGDNGEDGDDAGEESGEGGDAVIVTGDAEAGVNIVNIVNTNIINSNGWILMLNLFSSFFGDLDLRNAPFDLPEGCDFCNFFGSLNVFNNNEGSIENDVEITATSGANSASANLGSATIFTGNASAGANVINLLNTNIIGSNYLLLTINNFNDWAGDLVLPNKLFFEKFFAQTAGLPNQVDVENNNEASVETDGEVGADSGDNEANNNDGGSTIVTGDADAAININNEVNSNLFGGASLFILIKVHGNWNGNVFSLPPGAAWEQGPGGLTIFGLNLGEEGAQTEGAGDGTGGFSSLDLTNNNIGSIKNNLRIFALTGSNQASNNGGSATIVTGDAKAGANVVNFVNTNIVGRNWILALVNIFGDWEGDIAFGRPDLWVGGTAVVDKSPADPGARVKYEMTIFNRGDADATRVKLASIIDERFMSVMDYGEGHNGGAENMVNWDLGTIPMGESVTVSFEADIAPSVPFGSTTINNTAAVTSFETDEDNKDNIDIISFEVFNSNAGAPGGPSTVTVIEKPKLKITKEHDATGPVRRGEEINFLVTLTNEGRSPAYGVKVTDWLLDAEQNIIKEQIWELQEVLVGEEIMLEYTLEIVADAPEGTYTNTAFAIGRDGQNNLTRTEDATTEFEITTDVAAGSGKSITVENVGLAEFTAEAVLGAVSGETSAAEKLFIPDGPLSLALAEGQPLESPEAPLSGLLASLINRLPSLPAIILVLDALFIFWLFMMAGKRRKKGGAKSIDKRRLKPRH